MKDGEKSLYKVFEILDVVSEFDQGITAKIVIDRLQLPRSTVYRMLKFLEAKGYLYNRNNLYTLGVGALKLGAAAKAQNPLLRIARPFLEELAGITRETAHLAELRGKQVIYTDKVEGSRTIRMGSMIGKLSPVYCTGIGKSMLAFMAPEEVDDLLEGVEFKKMTETTLTSKPALLEELVVIAGQGYAVDNCEHEPGVFCVAAPLLNAAGRAVAAISIAGSEIYMREKCDELANIVKMTATNISKQLTG